MMRPVHYITAQEENFRLEAIPGTDARMIRRDYVEPEPRGTIVLLAFRITGYSADCDGSALVCLEQIDINGEETGWSENSIGLYETSALVLSGIEELKNLFNENHDV